MPRDFSKPFYQSAAWRKARAAYVKKRQLADGGLCEVCMTRAGEEVHHVKPLTAETVSDPAISLGEDNLRFLCRECHFRTRDDNFGRFMPQFETQAGAYFDLEKGKGGAKASAPPEPKLKQQKVYLVYGAPFAGKSEYVRKHMKHGDFVLNMEDLFMSFSGSKYDFPQALFGNVCDIRDFVIDKIARGEINARTVWVIEQLPERSRRENRAKQLHAEQIFIEASREDCVSRVHRAAKCKNKDLFFRLIAKWFENYS
jgi:predicted kinase